jgi:hypothetical protein
MGSSSNDISRTYSSGVSVRLLTREKVATLCGELEALKPLEPYVRPPTRRFAPTAAERDLAELRRDPKSLRKRLHELTGNPAVQQALLEQVREASGGD